MNKLIPFFILFFALNVFSQKEANIWYFGENAGIDFNSSPPVALTDGLLNTLEGCSTFSDKDGNLLFYSDGITVWNKNHKIMQYTDLTDADNLKGDPSSTQSGVIIPKPGSSSIYYLFTVDDGPEYEIIADEWTLVEDGKGFNAYAIDMNLDGGIGQLIDEDKDGVFYEDLSDGKFNNWEEKVAAVKGYKCDTYWVVSVVDNEFYSYFVNDTGISSTPVISNITTSMLRRGYLKISPNGTKLAIANQYDDFRNSAILYDFNPKTGEVSNNEIKLIDGIFSGLGEAYGVEFSSDSKKLYISTTSGFRDLLSDTAVTYKLFQFDLTAANIPDSKSLVHIQEANSSDYLEGGFRGALQLGPDGKIYATIPLAYGDPASFAPFLDVIENPTADAGDIIFTKNAIDLQGKFATQGLPPFISSLLLPISISDDSGLSSNNMDLKTCIGSSKVITPENIDDISNLNYIWTFEIGTSVTEISNSPTQKSLNLSNIQLIDKGTYKLKVEGNDDCSNPVQYNATFNLDVFKAATATKPDNINSCDEDLNGSNTFDLQNDTDLKDKILTGLDASNFDILYFDDSDKANDNVAGADLPNPYNLNTGSTQIIYARVHNKKAADTCFAITEFKLKVTGIPAPTQPTEYRICETATGSKTALFRLNKRDTEILIGVTNPTNYFISYHTNLIDAQTSSSTNAIPKNTDYEVTMSKKIYVRIENIDNTDCNIISDDASGSAFTSFELVVDPLPIIFDGVIDQCIIPGDPNPTINLTTAEFGLNSLSIPDLTFEYFENIAGSIPIAIPTSYPVIVNMPKSVYVRAISDQECGSDMVKLDLNIAEVSDTPFKDTVAIECDDFLDPKGNNTPGMNDDTDNRTNFTLNKTILKSKIYASAGGVIPYSDVFFYENISDRNNNKFIRDIGNYRNDPTNIDITDIPGIGISFPIYYKILSTLNNDCQGIGQFYLQIQSVPIANTPANFDLCDDALSGKTTDGINNGINLRTRVDDILGPTEIDLGYDVTFHNSQADANDLTSMGIPNDTNFTNTPQAGFKSGEISEQKIFVRVKNTDGCINNPTSFKIIVNPIPSISNTLTPFPVCDIVTSSDGDPRNRIAQNIDLTSKNDEVLARKTNHRVAYYLTPKDAIDNVEIINPTDFQNGGVLLDGTPLTKFPADFNTDDPAIQTIFVKVFDLGGNKCSSVFSTFQVVIYPEPNIPLNISNYSDCDNKTGSDADDTNGINGNITLKNKIPEILTNYDPSEFADFAVRFYASPTEAEIGDPTNALNENTFENDTNEQEIFVRVENIKNTPIICVNTRLSFKINIKPLPDFTVMGEENIEDPLIICLNNASLVLEAENPLATYAYQWKNLAGDLLGTAATQEVIAAGKYTVTASDISPIGCSRKRTIVVKESDIATLGQSFITIIDESNNIGNENKLSIFIDTISNDLGPGDYQFAIINTDNGTRTPLIGFQDEPIFENLEGAIYTIIVNDKNGCVPDATLQVSVLQFPKFFTPNGDDRNDTYKVKGANKTFYPNSSINIFNRYGKLVAQIPIDSQGWDGTYNGKKLSSDDYWYNITLIPADNTKQIINKTGNFSLLRK